MPDAIKDFSKRPLGRGLGSLLGDDISAVSASKTPSNDIGPASAQRIWDVDIEKIVPNSEQPRKAFAAEKLKELAQSIKAKGVLQPILARRLEQDLFEIIAGERRWRAAQIAGLKKVPVILKQTEEQDRLEIALIENIQRHDLNAIEEGEAYRLLIDKFNLTQQQLADKVGKERATIANALRLLALDSSVKDMIIRGELSPGHAKALLALNDAEKQKELAKKINTEKLTVRAAEKLVQTTLRRDGSDPSGLDVDIKKTLVRGLQNDLSRKLGTKVDILYSKGKGFIRIKFYSDDNLTQIIDQIKNS